MSEKKPAVVGIIMGSISDWGTMKEAAKALEELEIPYEKAVISAHRTPKKLIEYVETMDQRGVKIIIAGAGGAAHLAGVTAAFTHLPVLAVPIQSKALNGLDSLLSMVQMPGGIPVPTLAIGEAGAKNAGLTAASILSISDPEVEARLLAYRENMRKKVEAAQFPED